MILKRLMKSSGQDLGEGGRGNVLLLKCYSGTGLLHQVNWRVGYSWGIVSKLHSALPTLDKSRQNVNLM